MNDFAISINEFLSFRKYDILQGKGTISKSYAEKKDIQEYDEFNKHQNILSDIDKELKKLTKKIGTLNYQINENLRGETV